MLNFNKKINIFKVILNKKETSYADSFNAYIDVIGGNYDYIFLEKLRTKQDIERWIEKLKSRIVLIEDDAVLEDIIDDYILFG